jgi:hypothetical protein
MALGAYIDPLVARLAREKQQRERAGLDEMDERDQFGKRIRLQTIQEKMRKYPGRQPNGTGPTGLTAPWDAKGWSDMLNEQTEALNLSNDLAGKGPVSVRGRYPGTTGGRGDYGGDEPMMRVFSGGERNNAINQRLAHGGARNALEGLQLANAIQYEENLGQNLRFAGDPGAARSSELYTEPYLERRRADVDRDIASADFSQQTEDLFGRGVREAELTLDPTVNRAADIEQARERELLSTRYRDPRLIDQATRLGVASTNAGARIGAEEIQGDTSRGIAALRELGRMAREPGESYNLIDPTEAVPYREELDRQLLPGGGDASGVNDVVQWFGQNYPGQDFDGEIMLNMIERGLTPFDPNLITPDDRAQLLGQGLALPPGWQSPLNAPFTQPR